MEPKFNLEEFKPAGDGFVKNEAIEDKEKAERMAHVEHSIRSRMDEAVEIAMAEIKKNTIEKETKRAMFAGVDEGEKYDLEKLKEEIEKYRSIEDLQAVKLGEPYCCGFDHRMQEVAYSLIGSGKVTSGNFAMKKCNGTYFLVKDKKVLAHMEEEEYVDYLDSFLKK